MNALLCLAFFASGCASLLFETLWFRQTGLLLGNSVWASSLVTASFMGGLAMGSALAARMGGRVRRPVAAYGFLELAVGAAGITLVLLLPLLPPLMAPFLSRFVFASAVEIEFDAQGRFVLPAYLREAAGLEGEAVVVGSLDHAEIWSPVRWEDYRRALEAPDALAQHLAGLGI